ncbi:MAG: hypothetical protein U0821_00790 [Chloroflexota bacterium]
MTEFEILLITPRDCRGFVAELNWGSLDIALLYELYDRDPPAMLRLLLADGARAAHIEMSAVRLRDAIRRQRHRLDSLGAPTEEPLAVEELRDLSEAEAAEVRQRWSAPGLPVVIDHCESADSRSCTLRAGTIRLGQVARGPDGNAVFSSRPGSNSLPDIWVVSEDLERALSEAIDYVQ